MAAVPVAVVGGVAFMASAAVGAVGPARCSPAETYAGCALYTEATDESVFVVPEGAIDVFAEVRGADGGNGGNSSVPGLGGAGGSASGTIPGALPGDRLWITVGGVNGVGGGGSAQPDPLGDKGGTGGGLSAVWLGPPPLQQSQALIVAGGGGGGSVYVTSTSFPAAGAGGGVAGGHGTSTAPFASDTAAQGGTATAGGAAGAGNGTSGTALRGGDGSDSGFGGAGGGGAGYFGGGGGNSSQGATGSGGGGSGFIADSITSALLTQGEGAGTDRDGLVRLQWRVLTPEGDLSVLRAVADGASSVLATVVVSVNGVRESTGGRSVEFSHSLGQISAVADNADGTYTVRLSSLEVGSATLSYIVDGVAGEPLNIEFTEPIVDPGSTEPVRPPFTEPVRPPFTEPVIPATASPSPSRPLPATGSDGFPGTQAVVAAILVASGIAIRIIASRDRPLRSRPGSA